MRNVGKDFKEISFAPQRSVRLEMRLYICVMIKRSVKIVKVALTSWSYISLLWKTKDMLLILIELVLWCPQIHCAHTVLTHYCIFWVHAETTRSLHLYADFFRYVKTTRPCRIFRRRYSVRKTKKPCQNALYFFRNNKIPGQVVLKGWFPVNFLYWSSKKDWD